jgi:extracellular factor (EF) 3-hydroxypalmitic acid methyl ester biosynthesis protein
MAGSRSTASDLAPAAEPRRTGRAEHGGRTVPLVVTAASRLSLQVEIQGTLRLADGVVLEGIDLDLDRGPVRLGRCRFVAEGGAARETCGRLVFLDDVYDCRSLVEDGQFVDLRGFFHNLPLVIAQRERIRPEFRDWCANLVYDLSVYKRFFDEQDRIVAGEPDDVAHAARGALMRTEGRRFLDFLDRKVTEMNALIREYTQEEHERHGFYLRRQIWPYLMSSAFLQRTNLKPRGYAGDAELMIMLYENTYVGTYVFNQLMHKHPVETRAADAVRFRRALIPQVFRQVLPDFPDVGARGFRVLSLAAGPAWELHDIVRDRAEAERVDLTLLDQDPFALDLARETVRRVEAERGVRLSVRYVQDSVRTMLRSRELKRAVGQHHFVYSMGLFDYLTTPVARAVLAKAYDLLEPGGTMLVGNYHVATPTRWHMAYWADWSLVYRTEEGFLELARELAPEPASVSIQYDESRCQMFMRVRKPR